MQYTKPNLNPSSLKSYERNALFQCNSRTMRSDTTDTNQNPVMGVRAELQKKVTLTNL